MEELSYSISSKPQFFYPQGWEEDISKLEKEIITGELPFDELNLKIIFKRKKNMKVDITQEEYDQVRISIREDKGIYKIYFKTLRSRNNKPFLLFLNENFKNQELNQSRVKISNDGVLLKPKEIVEIGTVEILENQTIICNMKVTMYEQSNRLREYSSQVYENVKSNVFQSLNTLSKKLDIQDEEFEKYIGTLKKRPN